MADLRILGFGTGVNQVARTGNQQHNAETTATVAKNQEPVFKRQNVETSGAIAFDQQDSSSQGSSFMAMA
ncbi:MAG: hypothetical protein K6A44_07755 [bacterium]|nr:hypothetical protein [bacterium]